jgi:hypothetical protein
MDLFNVIRKHMDEVGGQFTDYDTKKAIIVVPLEQGRFHTIILTIEKNKTTSNEFALFTTKVCEYAEAIDLKELLEQNAKSTYSKFIMEDDQIKVQAVLILNTDSEGEIKFLVQEVASLADRYELKLTGKDIH